jgi:hypothetical protein
VEVFRSVLVFGAVTAADVSASEAQPKMDPRVAHSQTFFASSGGGRHFANLFKVMTGRSHGSFSPGV